MHSKFSILWLVCFIFLYFFFHISMELSLGIIIIALPMFVRCTSAFVHKTICVRNLATTVLHCGGGGDEERRKGGEGWKENTTSVAIFVLRARESTWCKIQLYRHLDAILKMEIENTSRKERICRRWGRSARVKEWMKARLCLCLFPSNFQTVKWNNERPENSKLSTNWLDSTRLDCTALSKFVCWRNWVAGWLADSGLFVPYRIGAML